jgi:hypothetical protein
MGFGHFECLGTGAVRCKLQSDCVRGLRNTRRRAFGMRKTPVGGGSQAFRMLWGLARTSGGGELGNRVARTPVGRPFERTVVSCQADPNAVSCADNSVCGDYTCSLPAGVCNVTCEFSECSDGWCDQNNHRCVPNCPDGTPDLCRGYACDTSQCKNTCLSNADCAPGFECPDYDCVMPPACTDPSQCGLYTCNTELGKCRLTCSQDSDCTGGYVCWRRQCMQPCTQDSECAPGRYCTAISDASINPSVCF